MNILFITDNFPPEVNAPATRTYEHAKIWVDAGHNVTVITCVPNFPQGEVFDGYQNKWKHEEWLDGIKIVRVWSYITINEGVFRRSLDYLSFAVFSFWHGLTEKAEVIVATSPQFFTTWAGWALSKSKRLPWVFELRDLWPESIKTVGAINEGWLYQILESIELFLYRSANLIIPVTHSFKTNLVERGISADKQVVIPNGSNLNLFDPESNGNALKGCLGLQDKFVVGYLGTHGMAHGLDFILSSIENINDEDIHFLFIGDGAEKKALERQAADLNLPNVTFLDPVPKEEVSRYLAIFDVSLVPLKRSDTFKNVIPSKIFEAAAMQTPILLGVEGEAQKIIENFNAGLCFKPENEEDFINKLLLLKRDKSLYFQTAKNGEELARYYNRKKLAHNMLSELEKLVKGQQ